jgi:hypothetical protein
MLGYASEAKSNHKNTMFEHYLIFCCGYRPVVWHVLKLA